MRVLAASTAGAGHFGPLEPILQALARRGDDVLVVGPPSLAAAAGAAGLCFRAGAEPPLEEQASIWEQFPKVSRREAGALIDRELFARLCTAAMLPVMEAVCDEWRPDLVMREPCEYASAVAAERRSIPLAQVAISLAEIEASVLELVAPVLATYGEQMADRLLASPYLTRFPPSLDPSPFPATWRWRPGDEAEHRPLPAWWGANSAPLVYVTFGTVTGQLPVAATTYRSALDAVAGLRARVLLTAGRTTDVSVLAPLPPNVHVEPWVPQGDVLADAAAVVCHGGSGTVIGALSAGVPLVVVPMFADQPANARLVAKAGAGLVVEPARGVGDAMGALRPEDAARLRAAIEAVLAEASYRHAASVLADEVRSLPTAHELVETLAAELAAGSGGWGGGA
ncbi:MAG TPA: glycosyltransferase [Acidimicrobiales bacterium]|nr:glycosyltransferase [Acidimicrobiales bacterium]